MESWQWLVGEGSHDKENEEQLKKGRETASEQEKERERWAIGPVRELSW